MVVVVDPVADPKQIQDKLSLMLEKEGFTVGSVAAWGKKILAYPIRKKTEGLYFLYSVTSTTAEPKKIHQRFKLEESVLRAIILKKEKSIDTNIQINTNDTNKTLNI